MPADPADIIRATRAAQVVSRVDPSVRLQFPAARDNLSTPEAGYFVTADDARAALAAKAELLGAPRRRWIVSLAEELAIDPVTSIPTLWLTDDELGVSLAVLPARVEHSLETELTTLEVIG